MMRLSIGGRGLFRECGLRQCAGSVAAKIAPRILRRGPAPPQDWDPLCEQAGLWRILWMRSP
jgi:hypothetical protein